MGVNTDIIAILIAIFSFIFSIIAFIDSKKKIKIEKTPILVLKEQYLIAKNTYTFDEREKKIEKKSFELRACIMKNGVKFIRRHTFIVNMSEKEESLTEREYDRYINYSRIVVQNVGFESLRVVVSKLIFEDSSGEVMMVLEQRNEELASFNKYLSIGEKVELYLTILFDSKAKEEMFDLDKIPEDVIEELNKIEGGNFLGVKLNYKPDKFEKVIICLKIQNTYGENFKQKLIYSSRNNTYTSWVDRQ